MLADTQERRPRIAVRRGRYVVIPRAMPGMTDVEVDLWLDAIQYCRKKNGPGVRCVLTAEDLTEDK
jgi:hypothetical protein